VVISYSCSWALLPCPVNAWRLQLWALCECELCAIIRACCVWPHVTVGRFAAARRHARPWPAWLQCLAMELLTQLSLDSSRRDRQRAQCTSRCRQTGHVHCCCIAPLLLIPDLASPRSTVPMHAMNHPGGLHFTSPAVDALTSLSDIIRRPC
jgi:hypothetical protein